MLYLYALLKLKALVSVSGVFCFSINVSGGQSLRLRDLQII